MSEPDQPRISKPMDIKAYSARLADAARRAGFKEQFYGSIDGTGLPALCRESSDLNAPVVYISSGIHGDEPAGPLAILDLLRNRRLPETMSFWILPLLNPSGLSLGTRKNAAGIDLNRDYRPMPETEEIRQHKKWLAGRSFDLALCLHEDYDAEGFYLYEVRDADMPKPPARRILQRVSALMPIDQRPLIDDMPNHAGLMKPPKELHQPDREDRPEALELFFEHTGICLTFETPSEALIVDRVRAQVAAVEECLAWTEDTLCDS